MNALRFTLGINSGNSIFIVAFVALCGALQTHFSRKGAVTENGSCHCWFHTETFAWHGTSSPSPSRLAPCHLSQSERPWHSGEVTGQTAKVYSFASGSPFWGAGALAPERARTLPPRSAALLQKAALQMPFSSTTPPVKKGFRNARRRF